MTVISCEDLVNIAVSMKWLAFLVRNAHFSLCRASLIAADSLSFPQPMVVLSVFLSPIQSALLDDRRVLLWARPSFLSGEAPFAVSPSSDGSLLPCPQYLSFIADMYGHALPNGCLSYESQSVNR